MSARCADDSTATTMQTIATATMTPMGTTTLRRARSQLVYGRVSGARGRATAGTMGAPESVLLIGLSRPETREQSLLFAFVLLESEAVRAGNRQFARFC